MNKIKFYNKFNFIFILYFVLFFLGVMFVLYKVENKIISSVISGEIKNEMKNSILLLLKEFELKENDFSVKSTVIKEDSSLKKNMYKKNYNELRKLLAEYQDRMAGTDIKIYIKDSEEKLETISFQNYLTEEEEHNKIVREAMKNEYFFIKAESIKGKLYLKNYISIREAGRIVGVVFLASEISGEYITKIKQILEMDITVYSENLKKIIDTSSEEMTKPSINKEELKNEIIYKENKNYILAAKKYKENGLIFGVIYELKEINMLQNRVKLKMVYFNMIVLIMILLSLNIFSKKVTIPIQKLILGINRVKNGDFNYKIDYFSKNEIGEAVSNFNSMTKQLKESSEKEKHLSELDKIASIGRMAASVAHEIKNPLQSISVIINMYKDDFETIDFQKKDFEVMSKEISRINKIIENLLDFSKKEDIKPERTNLTKLLEEMVVLTKKKANETGNEIKFLNSSDDNFYINCDGHLLKQAVLNIIINAIEATKNGKISVELLQKDEMLYVKIKDNGKGMTKEECLKSKEAFYTTKVNGTGIGLAVVKKILDIHQFGWEINSEKGVGTEIMINIDRSKNSKIFIEKMDYDKEIMERREK